MNAKHISRLYLEEDILHTFAKLFTSFHTACFIQIYKSLREQERGKINLDQLPEKWKSCIYVEEQIF